MVVERGYFFVRDFHRCSQETSMVSAMEQEENPHLRSVDDLMGAICTIVRQELARALHSAVEDWLLTVSEATEYPRLAKVTIYYSLV